jgi:hypothetical protein
MSKSTLLFASLALFGVAASASAQSSVAVGDHPEYQFRRPLLNGMGLSSLAEMQGKPVLVEFWGTR